MDTLQQVIARQHIMEVKARYCRFLDTRDWEGFAALFTDDAVLDVREDTGAEPFHGRQAIVATVQAAVAHARSAHQVHNPEITFESADTAHVIWAMQDRVVWEKGKSPIPTASGITGYGHYRETYVRLSDVWLIASLQLTRFLVDFEP